MKTPHGTIAGSPRRNRRRCGLLLGLGVGLVAMGCDSRDPNRALTVDEQGALLRDVRSNPSRLNTLTPAERSYLVKKTGK
jgi:hypothetical protein